MEIHAFCTHEHRTDDTFGNTGKILGLYRFRIPLYNELHTDVPAFADVSQLIHFTAVESWKRLDVFVKS